MVRWLVLCAWFLTSCDRELEKMAPPERAKVDPLAPPSPVFVAEPEMAIVYEEVESNADVVIDVVVHGSRDDQVVRHSIPMKRHLVPKGYQSGSLGGVIGDSFDDQGYVTAA